MFIIFASWVVGLGLEVETSGRASVGNSPLGIRVRVGYVETVRQRSQGVSSWLERMCM